MGRYCRFVVKDVLPQPHWDHPKLVDKTITAAIKLKSTDTLISLAEYTISKPHTKGMTASIDKIIAAAIKFEDSNILVALVCYTFSKPYTKGMAKSINKTISCGHRVI